MTEYDMFQGTSGVAGYKRVVTAVQTVAAAIMGGSP